MDKRLSGYNKILKKHFGYDSLKKEQFDTIDKLVHDKKSILLIVSTGFGKSLCFQLPYLITKKNVIVVSPLVALMADQQSQMEKLGIPVCILNNTNKNKTYEKMAILNGEPKIIYITPEYLEYCEDFITQLYNDDALCLICIDEAHCISTWGSDFRKSYTRLGVINDWINEEIPILALTATASKKVREDIIKVMKMDNAKTIIGSFDRPNLYIEVKSKSKDIKKDISGLLKKYKNEYIIVYCKTRDDTDKITKIINDMGINCVSYHAGLSNKSRDNVQNQFINGEVKCIVATVAFGMGINSASVRLVIHYGCSKNVESYYQEIGRAGRDGKQSECHMFYSSKDFIQNRYFLSEIKNEAYKKYQTEQIQNIEKYIYTKECRRILLLKSFDEKFETDDCKNCDNCLNKNNIEKIDFTIPCHQLLTIANVFDGKCGGTLLINVLRGSNAKNISEYTKKNKLYGVGKHQTIDWWKAVLRIIINNDFLQEIAFGKFGSTLKCSAKGSEWLKKINTTYIAIALDKIKQSDKLLLPITDEFKKFIKSKIIENEHELEEVLNDPDLVNDFKQLIDSDYKNSKTKKITKEKIIEVKDAEDTEDIINKPDNNNKKWSKDDEKKLLKDIKIIAIKDIAKQFNRTEGAIRSRISYIAWKLYEKNISVTKIAETTKMSEEKIKKVIAIYQLKNKNKKVTIPAKK